MTRESSGMLETRRSLNKAMAKVLRVTPAQNGSQPSKNKKRGKDMAKMVGILGISSKKRMRRLMMQGGHMQT